MGSTETMKPYWTNGRVVVWQGHVLDCLAAMEAGSVHCTVTSPPYWGLRAYPGSPVEWPAVSYAPMAGLPPVEVPAWSGCLGLEPTPEMFVGHIVLVARELGRVLRDDGTFFLNFGDSYATGAGKVGKCPGGGKQGENWQGLTTSPNRLPQKGLKPKDLIGIPWRVAFALQADGWYLRSDIIWAKGISFCPTYSGSCMPESVRDRPTTGHEHVFLLTKKPRYFYDGDAVREESGDFMGGGSPVGAGNHNGPSFSGKPTLYERGSGRNLRSVWTINPGNFPGSHFATFPPALVEPMIKAGTSAKGCCPECGASWVRVTEKTPEYAALCESEKGNWHPNPDGELERGHRDGPKTAHGNISAGYVTTGWRPTCTCGTEHPIPQEELDADPSLLDDFEIEPFEPVPCTVLDPFLGSGTTAEVADFLGRYSVGIELSKKYCDEHIIPRLTEPLFEWAAQETQEPKPEIEQMELL